MSTAWQYHALKSFSWIICLLPYPIVLAIGKLLGKLYYWLATKQRRRALAQIQQSLQLSEAEAGPIIEQLFINIGQIVVEVMYTPRLSPDNIAEYITMENEQYVAEVLGQGRGVVFLTAHVGNWEWLGAAMAFAGFPMTSVIKRQPNEQHTRLLNEFRSMVGIELFARGGSEMLGAARALKKGKVLGFLSDQDGGKNGLRMPFLGKMASTPQGAAVFAQKFNAPIVPGFIIRKPDGGHKVCFYPPLYYEDTGDEEQDIYHLTERYTKMIETIIREHPDQWLWFQKRWNTKCDSVVSEQGR